MDVIKTIQTLGIVPVIKIEREADAIAVCTALCQGGLPVAEITFRTEAAEACIRRASAQMPDMLFGAGTILDVAQAQRAVAAGARFIVTPGFNEEVVRWCVEHGVCVIPGCPTTTDIEAALRLGIHTVKFFPAEAMGGPKMIAALCGPYSNVHFLPTGGINEENMLAYLHNPRVVAIGGSWMAGEKLIQTGDFAEIKKRTRDAMLKMLGFALQRITLYPCGQARTENTLENLASLIGWPVTVDEQAALLGNILELARENKGVNRGRITVGTNFLDRATGYLSGMGVAFDERSAVSRNGVRTEICLEETFEGMEVCLAQKI